MACDLGFQELASRNPFVRDLDELGYQLDLVHGYFVVYGLPYLDKAGCLKYGDWISPVDLTEEECLTRLKLTKLGFVVISRTTNLVAS